MSEKMSLSDSQLLKGFAILAVILIHVLAQFPFKIFYTQPYNQYVIFFDQFARFCVPLFVALSGYGFAAKYAEKHFELLPYLNHRLRKLLPLYVIWSIIFWVIIPAVPFWRTPWEPGSYLLQLIFGAADYQMYFVPMIFQLYLLFPFIWKFFHKFSTAWLLAALAVQAFVFYRWTSVIQLHPTQWDVLSGSYQYINSLSWIGYFVLGMWLAQPQMIKLIRKIPMLIWAGVVVALLFLSYSISIAHIQQGMDPLLALRFTKWPIFGYALAFIALSIGYVASVKQHLPSLKSILEWAGEHSFLLFLSHTLALRIIFGAWRGVLDFHWTLALSGIFVAAFVGSIQFQKKV